MVRIWDIDDALKRSEIEIDSDVPYKILCEHLIPYQKEKLPDNTNFKIAAGKKTYDIIRLYESGELFFSKKFIDVMSQFVNMSNKCYPIKIEGVDEHYYVIYNLDAYSYLNKAKAMFNEEPPFFCGVEINVPLFSIVDTHRFVITENIKKALIKNKITNIAFSEEFLCTEEEHKEWQKSNSRIKEV